MPYKPKYCSIDRVPWSGSQVIDDRFTTEGKLWAIEEAEEVLEADVNEGQPINGAGPLHASAVAVWATYILSVGPVEPGHVKGGHFADKGDRVGEHLKQLERTYDRYVDRIQASEGDPGRFGSHHTAVGGQSS